MTGCLRDRATVVVVRNGRVLLVRGNSGKFVMPGGGIDPGELPIAAAARELQEETGLDAESVEPLFVWESAIHRHHVFRVDAGGDVAMGPEITDFRWWNRRECLPTYSHVEAILERLRGLATSIRDGAEQ